MGEISCKYGDEFGFDSAQRNDDALKTRKPDVKTSSKLAYIVT